MVCAFHNVRYRSRDCSRANTLGREKPASLTYEQAAAVPVAGITASIALNKARVDKIASVFIAGGAGGAGTFTSYLPDSLACGTWSPLPERESRDYWIAHCGLSDDRIIDYKNGQLHRASTAAQWRRVGRCPGSGRWHMLSACCVLLALDDNRASITEAPGQDDRGLVQICRRAVGATPPLRTTVRSAKIHGKYWITYRSI